MAAERTQPQGKQITRRDFLVKGALAAAALVAVSTPLRNRFGSASPEQAPLPRFPGQGSMFQPRLDQRARGWLRWHNPLRR